MSGEGLEIRIGTMTKPTVFQTLFKMRLTNNIQEHILLYEDLPYDMKATVAQSLIETELGLLKHLGGNFYRPEQEVIENDAVEVLDAIYTYWAERGEME